MDLDYIGQYIVIDLEFSKKRTGTEIVEIAAKRVLLKEGMIIEEGDCFKKTVKPQHKPSKSLLQLIDITEEELEGSDSFPKAYNELRKWVNQKDLDTIFIAWGNRDAIVLKTDCKNYGLMKEYNEMSFVDLQSYIMVKNDIKHLPSLIKIVEREFGKFEGVEHHAIDDATNTAKILRNHL